MSDFKQYTGFDGVSVSTARTFDFKDALNPIPVEMPSTTADDVLRDIDQLRRDLSGYHGQLKAHNDLQRHCDNQRKRITELEGLYAKSKDENAKLRELLREMWMFTKLVNVSARLSNGGAWSAAKFEKRMREMGVIE